MDQHTRETRFARCSQLWDAATSRRRYRTYWQDQAAAKTARRNQRKADALKTIAETLLSAATVAVGVTAFYLLANIPQVLAVTGAIAGSFAADSYLRPMFTATFGPTINRLRGLEPEGVDQ